MDKNETVEQQAAKANAAVGYGPNNPEPIQFKEDQKKPPKDSLEAVSEYINRDRN
ncbi:MAG: hypothetical protein E6713_16545 [Sporomusaceae bacterium]|nr:hypothetical protein [Sporomusaceae bacterium]